MKHRLSRFCLLLVAILGMSLTAFAVTDEINRIAERADKLYVKGRYDDAFPLMKRAAEGGDVISMFTLGTMYCEGQGTVKNIGEARRWWQEAANHGDTMAKDYLKRLDEKQRSTPIRTNTYTVNGVSFTMVYVEGGSFTMGAKAEAPSEEPAHQVTLSGFSIGQTEVTQELWLAVMGYNPSHFARDPQRPVENVTWNDCQTFITTLNQLTGQDFRLPTEAEWEYAALGGNRSHGYKYSGSNTIGDVAWYKDNTLALGPYSPDFGTHIVATKSPNELGLYDMSGNVSEWCQDWYDRNYYSSSPQTNPSGPASGTDRMCRGGYWSERATISRVSCRSCMPPSYKSESIGLRLAL